MSTGKRIGYIRVSSADQNIARQQAEMEKLQLNKLYVEHASGKNTTQRPQLQLMLDYLRDDDELYVVSMDRLARNLEDLLRLVNELQSKGVTVHFLKENMTFSPGTSDPMSKMLLSVMGAVAEFERSLIRERQREGIAQAKERGAYTGRKPLPREKVEEALRLLQSGMSKQAAARQLGISRTSLYKYLKTAVDPQISACANAETEGAPA